MPVVASLRSLVLAAIDHLRVIGKDAYGLSIRDEIQRMTGRSVGLGRIYAMVAFLEDKEALTSKDSEKIYPERGNRPRRLYFRKEKEKK